MGDNLDELGNPIQNPTGENQDNKSAQPSDKLDPEIQRRDAQIAHWREKAEKAEQKLNTFNQPSNPSPEPKKDNVEIWEAPQDPLEVVRLGKALQNYDPEETEFIIRNASNKTIDGIIKAEQDEMVQLAIKSRREKVAKENKIPAPGSPGGGYNEKSPAEIAKMSREEHMAYEREISDRMRSQGV